MKENICVRVDSNDIKELRNIAASEGRTLSNLIQKIFKDYLKTK